MSLIEEDEDMIGPASMMSYWTDLMRRWLVERLGPTGPLPQHYQEGMILPSKGQYPRCRCGKEASLASNHRQPVSEVEKYMLEAWKQIHCGKRNRQTWEASYRKLVEWAVS